MTSGRYGAKFGASPTAEAEERNRPRQLHSRGPEETQPARLCSRHMSKEEVSKETLSDDQVAALCAQFPSVKLPLVEHGVLFGGYSGTSVRVTGADGVKHVLKVCHGYSVADAMQQSAVASHAAKAGFLGVCAPEPLGDESSKTPCVYSRPGDGTPVTLLATQQRAALDAFFARHRLDSPATTRLPLKKRARGRRHTLACRSASPRQHAQQPTLCGALLRSLAQAASRPAATARHR